MLRCHPPGFRHALTTMKIVRSVNLGSAVAVTALAAKDVNGVIEVSVLNRRHRVRKPCF